MIILDTDLVSGATKPEPHPADLAVKARAAGKGFIAGIAVSRGFIKALGDVGLYLAGGNLLGRFANKRLFGNTSQFLSALEIECLKLTIAPAMKMQVQGMTSALHTAIPKGSFLIMFGMDADRPAKTDRSSSTEA